MLALVPARAGSKGVRGKNFRSVGGRPLIYYTLRAALDARDIDEVFVTSDDQAILAYALEQGANPVERPERFATDTASAVDVVNHFIATLPADLLQQNPYIVYLQPTSPLRSATHIDTATALMGRMQLHTLISVVELEQSPYKSFLVSPDGLLQSLFDERLSNARRQDLPKTYLPNGAIYIYRVSDFIERSGFPSNGSIPFIMKQNDSLDIDSEEDMQNLAHILESRHE